MARISTLQASFTSGELDPLLAARSDVKHYYSGADKLRNVLPIPQGGAGRRPGLKYIDDVHDNISLVDLSAGGVTVTAPEGGTAANVYDNDEATVCTAVNNITTTDPYILVHVDLGAPTSILFADVVLLKLTAPGTTDEFRVQYSTDNITWNNQDGAYPAITDTAVTRRTTQPGDVHIGITAQYWRLAKIGGTDLGTNKASIAEFRLWEDAGVLSNTRLITFEFSTTQRYLILASDRNFAIHADGVHVADVPTPYTSAELPFINWTQSLDTLLVFHEDYPPRSFQRQGADDEWQPSDWTLSNIPTHDFGSGAEAVWSTTRGWPVCGTFFGGRLWLAGSKSRPQTIWASKAGGYTDFDTSGTAADRAIDVTADTDDVSAFYNIMPGPHLQFFASSAEFYIAVSASEAVTADNIVLRRTTKIGSSRSIRVFDVDGATMFVQGEGKTLREFIYNEGQQKYQANNMSLLASHLLRTPVSMAHRKASSTDEADYLLIVNSDGTLAVFCTLRTQEVNAFSLCETAGDFLDVGIDGSDIYFVVERNINGADIRYLEVFDSNLLVDCAVTETGLGAPVSSISSADHLEAETVQVILDDAIQATEVVASGVVTFDRAAASSYQVGLKFPDVQEGEITRLIANGIPEAEARRRVFDDENGAGIGLEDWIRTMKIEPNLPDGSKVGIKKRVVEASLELIDTTGVQVNDEFVAFQQFGSSLLDTAIAPFSGVKTVDGIIGWDERGQLDIGQPYPQKMLLAAIKMKVAV